MRIDRHQLWRMLHERLASTVAVAGALACGLLLSAAPRPAEASSKQAQLTGAKVFSSKGCQHCHGADATGTDRGPDLSSVGKKWHKDRIEEQIRVGGKGMPAFGDVLLPNEISALVDFLSAKRKVAPKAKNKSADPLPSPAKPLSDDSGE